MFFAAVILAISAVLAFAFATYVFVDESRAGAFDDVDEVMGR